MVAGVVAAVRGVLVFIFGVAADVDAVGCKAFSFTPTRALLCAGTVNPAAGTCSIRNE